KEFQVRAGIRCNVDLASEELRVDQERATALFRIFQELLTNVARHAAATKVEVLLRQAGGSVVLEGSGDGRGIGEAELRNPSSLGLLGMRERVAQFGGRIEITPRRGKGTSARVSIPVQELTQVEPQAS